MAPGGTSKGKPAPLPAPLLARLDNGRMPPLQQGDLDGLCGLYAVINALRLVLAPVRQVRRPEALLWFRTGLEALAETGNLEDFVAHGIGPGEWLNLMEDLTELASSKGDHYICVSQPLRYAARAPRSRMYEAIEDAIMRGRAVLITLSGVHNHYTLVSGFSSSNLWLFDSGKLQRIARAHCGTQRSGDKWRHRINVRTLTVLSLTPKQKSSITTVRTPSR